MLNGHELVADVDEAERTILGVAASAASRERFVVWVRTHLRPLGASK